MRALSWRLFSALILTSLLATAVVSTLAETAPFPPPFTPPGEKAELVWIPGDNHHHSTYSDGKATVTQIMALAKENGLGWMVFSDHRQALDEQTFARQMAEIEEASKATGVVGLQGEEIASRNVEGSAGHLVVLNYQAHEINDNQLGAAELLAKLGAVQPEDPPFVIIAHPFDRFYPWGAWGESLLSGLELMNGAADRGQPPNAKLLRNWDWYQGHQIGEAYFGRRRAVGTAGSDGHGLEIGGQLPVTYLALPKEFDGADVLAALRAGRAVASSRQGLMTDLWLNDVPIGGVVGLELGTPLRFKANFAYGGGSFQAGLAELYLIRGTVDGATATIYKFPRQVKNPMANRPATFEQVVTIRDRSYLFAPSFYRLAAVFQTKDGGGGKTARRFVYTNPIFVKPLGVPINVALERTPVEIAGTNVNETLSFQVVLQPETMTEIQARAVVESSARVRTGVQFALYDSEEKPVLVSERLAQGKGLRRTAFHAFKTAGLEPGRYRLAVTASNAAEGRGRVVSQAVYITWLK